ncbi:MAG: putative Ig domain-containing protein [Synergistaceae bacterium]|nr:putative Ig domain-containing protein [Synergistaceae bacterium]
MKRSGYVFFLCVIVLLSFAASCYAENFSATTAGTHAISLTSGTASHVNATVTKTGDATGSSDGASGYDWTGSNAAVFASGGAQLTLSGSSTTINSDAVGGNAVFSYGGNLNGSNSGNGTKIIISDATITTTKNNSGGIMVTGGGIISADRLSITTSGGSSAAIRADRGGGTINVKGGTYTTNGQGSPAIYSTATIAGADVTLVSGIAQVVVIEGGNSVSLTNSNLTANHTTLNGQDTTHQAVLIYQSMSGDASDGSSYFTMAGGSLTNSQGDIFHVTNTTTTITLNSVTITNSDASGYLLRASADSWGTSGSNGGKVTLNATNQTLAGNILVDSASRLNMSLYGTSTFTGAVNTSGQAGAVKVTVSEGTTWTLTADSYVSALENKGTITLGSFKLYVNGTEYDGTSESAGSYDDSDDDETSGTAPVISTDVLKDATVGKSYSFMLKAGGTKPITWSADVALQDGFTLNASTGYIKGKPTVRASYPLTITASNSAGSTNKVFTLNVLDEKPTIKSFSAKTAYVDVPYKLTFTASKGTGDITWEISDDIPAGLSFDTVSAELSGIPSAAFNGYVRVGATNSGGSAVKRFKLTVKSQKPVISITGMGDAVKGQPYTASASVTGTNPITVTVNKLPAGVTYAYVSKDAAVNFSGTPTDWGKFSVKITAQNTGGKTTKTKSLKVNSAPAITTTTLKEATTGKSYSAKLKADGTKKIAWSVAEGSSLPAGINLKESSGALSGKTTGDGTYTVRFAATNDYGSDSKDLTLKVNAVAPKIRTSSLKKGTAGSPYSVTLKATGSTPLTWGCESTLPDGITFSDGTFSGTSTKAFSGNVTVTLSNNGGSVSKTYALVMKALKPTITTASLPSGTKGQAYTAMLEATGTPDIAWSWSGNPAGLALNAGTGAISGTPTASGTFRVKVTATNDAKASSKKISLTIADTESASNNAALPEDEEPGSETQDVSEMPEDEGRVLPEDLVIVAELGAISVDVAGMYDFDAELSGDAEIGAKMYWLARSSEPSEDDEIAEFSDEAGQETATVPESRKVKVSVWLMEGVTYEPAIAVSRK